MSKPDKMVFQLQKLVIAFAEIKRELYVPGRKRREDDVLHSYSVTMLCWYLMDRHKLALDQAKVFRYALAHDLVEVYAGDFNAFASPDKRRLKVKLEKQALEQLSGEFSAFPSLIETMRSYEEKADEEARFVWAVDKIQAVVTSSLDEWRFNQRLHISYQQFTDKYNEIAAKIPSYLKPLYSDIVRYCQKTYYDKPERHQN